MKGVPGLKNRNAQIYKLNAHQISTKILLTKYAVL